MCSGGRFLGPPEQFDQNSRNSPEHQRNSAGTTSRKLIGRTGTAGTSPYRGVFHCSGRAAPRAAGLRVTRRAAEAVAMLTAARPLPAVGVFTDDLIAYLTTALPCFGGRHLRRQNDCGNRNHAECRQELGHDLCPPFGPITQGATFPMNDFLPT